MSASEQDLVPALTASIAIVRERDRYRRERDELLEALRSIANNTCCNGCQEAAKVARYALAKVRS